MITKLKLFGMKRTDERIEVTLEKTQRFIPMIQHLVKELNGRVDWNLFTTRGDREKDVVEEKIESCIDKCEHSKYDDFELDVFVGKKRIIMIVRATTKFQKKFLDLLSKNCEWIK